MMSAENLIYIIRLAVFLPICFTVRKIIKFKNIKLEILNIKLKRLNYFKAMRVMQEKKNN